MSGCLSLFSGYICFIYTQNSLNNKIFSKLLGRIRAVHVTPFIHSYLIILINIYIIIVHAWF